MGLNWKSIKAVHVAKEEAEQWEHYQLTLGDFVS